MTSPIIKNMRMWNKSWFSKSLSTDSMVMLMRKGISHKYLQYSMKFWIHLWKQTKLMLGSELYEWKRKGNRLLLNFLQTHIITSSLRSHQIILLSIIHLLLDLLNHLDSNQNYILHQCKHYHKSRFLETLSNNQISHLDKIPLSNLLMMVMSIRKMLWFRKAMNISRLVRTRNHRPNSIWSAKMTTRIVNLNLAFKLRVI